MATTKLSEKKSSLGGMASFSPHDFARQFSTEGKQMEAFKTSCFYIGLLVAEGGCLASVPQSPDRTGCQASTTAEALSQAGGTASSSPGYQIPL